MAKKRNRKADFSQYLIYTLILGLILYGGGILSVTGEVPHKIISKNLTAQSGSVYFSDVLPDKVYQIEIQTLTCMPKYSTNPAISLYGALIDISTNTCDNGYYSDGGSAPETQHYFRSVITQQVQNFNPVIAYSISANGGIEFVANTVNPANAPLGQYYSTISVYQAVECVVDLDCNSGRTCLNNTCGSYNSNGSIYINQNCTTFGCPTGLSCMEGGKYCQKTEYIYQTCHELGGCPEGYLCNSTSEGYMCLEDKPHVGEEQALLYLVVGLALLVVLLLVVVYLKRR